MQIVRELEAVETGSTGHPRRRIVIVQRNDGWFALAEQYYYISRFEGMIVAEGWATLPPDGLFEDVAIAEAEARAAYRYWCPTS